MPSRRIVRGGPGSGRTPATTAKTTVEDSLVLTASALVRRKALVPGARTAGSWSWSYDGEDRPFATIGYETDLTVDGYQDPRLDGEMHCDVAVDALTD